MSPSFLSSSRLDFLNISYLRLVVIFLPRDIADIDNSVGDSTTNHKQQGAERSHDDEGFIPVGVGEYLRNCRRIHGWNTCLHYHLVARWNSEVALAIRALHLCTYIFNGYLVLIYVRFEQN